MLTQHPGGPFSQLDFSAQVDPIFAGEFEMGLQRPRNHPRWPRACPVPVEPLYWSRSAPLAMHGLLAVLGYSLPGFLPFRLLPFAGPAPPRPCSSRFLSLSIYVSACELSWQAVCLRSLLAPDGFRWTHSGARCGTAVLACSRLG